MISWFLSLASSRELRIRGRPSSRIRLRPQRAGIWRKWLIRAETREHREPLQQLTRNLTADISAKFVGWAKRSEPTNVFRVSRTNGGHGTFAPLPTPQFPRAGREKGGLQLRHLADGRADGALRFRDHAQRRGVVDDVGEAETADIGLHPHVVVALLQFGDRVGNLLLRIACEG